MRSIQSTIYESLRKLIDLDVVICSLLKSQLVIQTLYAASIGAPRPNRDLCTGAVMPTLPALAIATISEVFTAKDYHSVEITCQPTDFERREEEIPRPESANPTRGRWVKSAARVDGVLNRMKTVRLGPASRASKLGLAFIPEGATQLGLMQSTTLLCLGLLEAPATVRAAVVVAAGNYGVTEPHGQPLGANQVAATDAAIAVVVSFVMVRGFRGIG
jgi:hypothetical protein